MHRRDIQLQGVNALQSKTKKLIRCGEGSRYLDLKLPCGGALAIFLNPTPDAKAILDAAAGFATRRPVPLFFLGAQDSDPQISRALPYVPRHRLNLAE